MTDTTASSTSPDPQENQFLNQPEEGIHQPQGEADAGWESVTFPGHVPLAAISKPEPSRPEPLQAEAQTSSPESEGILPAADGGETAASSSPELAPENLVQLIQDLNQCNDALLLRVTELEDDLERSQIALQAEIERHQVPASPAGLPFETLPGPVQQQIAQLLSELDIANDGLRRTTIHNETLQGELEASQQRVAQLERECTLLQQRFSEKNTALHQAEETCRDLKARLHRQQRYTLQFKAALEKCLNMSPGAGKAASGVVQGQLLETGSAKDVAQPVAMPRSQQIQPWSAGQASLGDNPSLTHLLRGLRGAGPATPAPAAAQPRTLFESPVESGGVSERPPTQSSSPAIAPELSPKTTPELAANAAPAMPEPVSAEPASPAADPWMAAAPAAAPPLFTEPSPWGEPVAPAPTVGTTPAPAPVPPAPQPVPSAQPAPAAPVPQPAPAAQAAPSAPAMPAYLNANAKASPSPLVYPLRSQKKISSIAAVELPSFGRSVRRR